MPDLNLVVPAEGQVLKQEWLSKAGRESPRKQQNETQAETGPGMP